MGKDERKIGPAGPPSLNADVVDAPRAEGAKPGRTNPVPNSEATRFRPGQSGNPSGRPRKTLTEAYKDLLDTKYPNDPEGRTYAQVIAMSVLELAAKGNIRAAIEAADRTEGKVASQNEVSGANCEPIPIKFVSTLRGPIAESDSE
jgi:hypothetical protein